LIVFILGQRQLPHQLTVGSTPTTGNAINPFTMRRLLILPIAITCSFFSNIRIYGTPYPLNPAQ
jgi:hypothetical protein